MTVIGSGEIELLPNTKKFASQADVDISKSMTSIAKKAAGILAGAFAIHEGIGFFKDVLAGGEEVQKAMAQTAAVIKSTGGVAGVSAGQVGLLATAISRYSGIDDAAIQKGENLILTFTNIRNAAGKGNDIFNQTTKVVTDMSIALGEDLSNASIQVGKALQDPILGITALRRVGVNFNDSQKQVIKNLVETGRSLDAQKMILKELNVEFGGSAAAQATAGEKLMATYHALMEQLGTRVLPVFEEVANSIGKALPVAFDFLGSVMTGTIRVINDVAKFLNNNREVAAGLAGVITAALIPAVLRYAAVQSAAFGSKILDAIAGVGFAIQAVGAAFGAAGVAAELMTGSAVLVGVGLLAAAVYKLSSSSKTTADDVGRTKAALLDFARTQNFNDFLSKADFNMRKFNSDFMQWRGGILQSGQVGKAFDAVDKALAALVKEGHAKEARVLLEQIAEASGHTVAELQKNPKVLDDYNKALLGNKAALKENQLANQEAAQQVKNNMTSALQALSSETGFSTQRLSEMGDKLQVDFTKDVAGANEKIVALADRLKVGSSDALDFKDAMSVLGDRVSDATDKAKAFKTAMDLLLGRVSKTEAVVQMKDAVQSLSDSLKANGDSFDVNSAKGRLNVTALDDVFKATLNTIEIQQKQGDSNSALSQTWEQQKEATLRSVEALGLNQQQAQALLDQYGLFDGKTFQAILDANDSPARAAIDDMKTQLNNLLDSVKGIAADFIAPYKQIFGDGGITGAIHIPDSVKNFFGFGGGKKGVFGGGSASQFGMADGGWVPGSFNQPMPILAHGGEFVLSHKMLSDMKAGGTSNPSFNIEINAPGATAQTVDALRALARNEIANTINSVVRKATTGAGSK